MASSGLTYESHEVSPRWVYGDTVSWTRGTHAFKFGGEYRLSSTKSTLGGSVQGASNRPLATIGNATLAAVNGYRQDRAWRARNASGNQQIAENLLTLLVRIAWLACPGPFHQ